MRNTSLALLLLCALVITCRAQQAPPLLFHAAQCLAAKDFLPPSHVKALVFGYLLDSESYPGEKVLYVIDFERAGGSKGWAFAIFLTEKNDRQIFNIQNNARFVTSRSGDGGIDFVEEPLGGTWTRQHLISAINQIRRQPRFAIPISDLGKPPASIQCESYTDSYK